MDYKLIMIGIGVVIGYILYGRTPFEKPISIKKEFGNFVKEAIEEWYNDLSDEEKKKYRVRYNKLLEDADKCFLN